MMAWPAILAFAHLQWWVFEYDNFFDLTEPPFSNRNLKLFETFTLREKYPNSELFWPAFFRIRTK